MRITFDEFHWDGSNEEHLWERHQVAPEEVEEAFHNRPLGAEAYNHPRGLLSERRRAIIGETNDGRVLYIVYVIRSRKIRPLAARDATPQEKRRFRQWQK
jgi:uncharacterized DUF497 family protein